jgi:hypothetical protein
VGEKGLNYFFGLKCQMICVFWAWKGGFLFFFVGKVVEYIFFYGLKWAWKILFMLFFDVEFFSEGKAGMMFVRDGRWNTLGMNLLRLTGALEKGRRRSTKVCGDKGLEVGEDIDRVRQEVRHICEGNGAGEMVVFKRRRLCWWWRRGGQQAWRRWKCERWSGGEELYSLWRWMAGSLNGWVCLFLEIWIFFVGLSVFCLLLWNVLLVMKLGICGMWVDLWILVCCFGEVGKSIGRIDFLLFFFAGLLDIEHEMWRNSERRFHGYLWRRRKVGREDQIICLLNGILEAFWCGVLELETIGTGAHGNFSFGKDFPSLDCGRGMFFHSCEGLFDYFVSLVYIVKEKSWIIEVWKKEVWWMF